MSRFYNYDFGFSEMDREKLDALADSGGEIGRCSNSYMMPKASLPHDGYAMKIVARRGSGNLGVGVLVGTTPETRQRLRAGRAATLAAKYGVSYDFADTILSVGEYVHEDGCIRAIIAEWDSPAWDFYPTWRGTTIRHFCADYGVEMHGLTVPRFAAVAEACVRLRRAFRPRANCLSR